jgi:hypothetical protein
LPPTPKEINKTALDNLQPWDVYTDPAPPPRNNPVVPATRSDTAQRKAARHHNDTGTPLHSFRGLLEHMATLTRNTITLGQTSFDKIALPTPTQQRAFDLIGTPIPLTLT